MPTEWSTSAAGSFLFALDAKTGKPIPKLRQQRSGQCDPGRAPDAISGHENGDQSRILVHHGASGATTAFSTSAVPEARATFPAVTCSLSMRRRARFSGTSTRSRRTKRIRDGDCRPHLGRRRAQWRWDLGNAVDRP